MPITPTYPGVYIEEISSGVRTIVGVATSITAFMGRARRGPVSQTMTINSYADFERIFGGLWVESSLGYAVRDFYLNGGSQAIIVRLYRAETGGSPKPASSKLQIGGFKFEAAYPGTWGANLRGSVDLDNLTDPTLFNLTVRDTAPGGAAERFLNLSFDNASPRRIDRVLEAESKLVRWDGTLTPADLAAIRTAAAAVAEEQKKATPDPAVLAEKQDTLWGLTQDKVTITESKYTRAKRTREQKQNDGAPADQIKTAIDTEAAAKKDVDDAKKAMADAVSDGLALTVNDFLPPNGETEKKGLYALEQADLFNLLCIPPYRAPSDTLDVDVNLISAAASYCEKRRAMLLVDAPKNWIDKTTAKEKFSDTSDDHVGTRSRNAAIFFPRLMQPNPLRDNQIEEFAPCGAVAGIFARTDTQRGVWKAPAGLDATMVGVPQLEINLTDPENGELNPLGINCLRSFPFAGKVIWGARTLRGADQLADEYKYIPIRRTALFIEESLYRGLKWVVFEPNDEPLWSQIRLNVGAFMHNLFRQGAFQGRTPREAYFVKCDKETTTQNDINLGIVNIVVGFAPLKPAEFVIIKLQQMTGQIEV